MTQRDVPANVMIRRARTELGYSQYEFASRLADVSGNDSLTREEVARWERGKRIPGPYWRAWISRVLSLARGELEAAAKVARRARRALHGAAARQRPEPPGGVPRQRPEPGEVARQRPEQGRSAREWRGSASGCLPASPEVSGSAGSRQRLEHGTEVP